MKLPLVALALFIAAPQDKTELGWKLRKGQELRYRHTQNTAIEAGGQAVRHEVTTTFSLTVTELDDKGIAALTGKFLALATKAKAPQVYEYDSEKDKEPPAEPPLSLMARLVGQSFAAKMNPHGQVAEVKGFDKIVDAMVKDAGDSQAFLKHMMKQLFSDETHKGMMQQMFPPLPAGAVARGDSWANEFTVKLQLIGSVKYVMKSKLADLKEDSAFIENEIGIELKKGAENKDNPLAGMIELKVSKGTSSGVFSLSKGCYLSQRGTMAMTIQSGGQEMSMKTETEVKLLEEK